MVIRERNTGCSVHYVVPVYSGRDVRTTECTTDRRQPADRRCIADVTLKSSDARLRCNALTVSQQQAINRLIARRKRSTVSNVPCPVKFNRPLCCLCATNFVAGRLIFSSANVAFRIIVPIFIAINGAFALLRWNLMSGFCNAQL